MPGRKGLALLTTSLLAIVGLLGATIAPAGAAVGDITTYVDPAGNVVHPKGVTSGPGGYVWFTSFETDRIGRLDPATGAIVTYTDPEGEADGPGGITAGPDGNLWFTIHHNDGIGRFDPDDGSIETFPLPTGPGLDLRDPVEIVAGPDGNLWFTILVGDRIGRIDPADGSIDTYEVDPTDDLFNPIGITVGPDGNIWFTARPDGFGYIDPDDTSITLFSDDLVSDPHRIATGSDGNLWITVIGGFAKYDPVNDVLDMVPLPDGVICDRGAITPGPDGNMWSAHCDRFVRIDPDDDTMTVFSDPEGEINSVAGIAIGPDGNLWFANLSDDRVGALEITAALPTVPSAPLNVSAVSSGSGTATVRFAPPASAGSTPILDYQAQCGTQTAIGTGAGTIPHVNVTGLTNGQSVQCMVRARNSAGYGPFSAPVPFTVGVPSGPTNITGGPGTTRGSIVINWNAASPNGSPVTSYLVRCVPWNPSFPTRASLVGGAARTATLTNLAPGQAHACSVTPANANGSGNPQEAKPVALIKSKA